MKQGCQDSEQPWFDANMTGWAAKGQLYTLLLKVTFPVFPTVSY